MYKYTFFHVYCDPVKMSQRVLPNVLLLSICALLCRVSFRSFVLWPSFLEVPSRAILPEHGVQN